MTYEEVLDQARKTIQICKACPVCDGKACHKTIPGPGAKGKGQVAIKNYQAWQEIDLLMDTNVENKKVDTSCTLFGRKMDIPVFAGPVGAVDMHYGDAYKDSTYNPVLIQGCKEAGIVAFTGDGMDPEIVKVSSTSIKANDGVGIVTIKPWPNEIVMEKMAMAIDAKAIAIAMDIDAAGLPFLKSFTPPAGRKSVAQMKEIIEASPVPFIVKGVLSVAGALKAKEAGASAIVVSNHGGRVLDGAVPSAKVLKEIADAVGNDMTILVDGGIRSGQDIFKALALGADAVLIARPFVTSIYGAGQQGIQVYVDKLKSELIDTMEMCGANTLEEITFDKVKSPY